MQIVAHLEKPSLKAEFLAAKSVPHLHIKDFLDEKSAAELLKVVEKLDFEEKESDLFHFWQSKNLKILDDEKNNQLLKFFDLINSSKVKNFLSSISGLKITNADFHATKYVKTNYLLPHDDQLEGRKIAYIYYLSNLKKEEGGAFEFFSVDEKNKPLLVEKSVLPVANSLFLFEVSDKSFHQVSEVLKDAQRYALAGWFYG